MSKFGYVFIGYVLYISALYIGNIVSIANDKPVMALGFITKWWFMLSVFLFCYASEWLSILAMRQG